MKARIEMISGTGQIRTADADVIYCDGRDSIVDTRRGVFCAVEKWPDPENPVRVRSQRGGGVATIRIVELLDEEGSLLRDLALRSGGIRQYDRPFGGRGYEGVATFAFLGVRYRASGISRAYDADDLVAVKRAGTGPCWLSGLYPGCLLPDDHDGTCRTQRPYGRERR